LIKLDAKYMNTITNTVQDFDNIKEIHASLLELDNCGEKFLDYIIKDEKEPNFQFMDRHIYKKFFETGSIKLYWLVGNKNGGTKRSISVNTETDSYIFEVNEKKFPVEMYQILRHYSAVKTVIHEFQRIKLLLT